MNNFTIYFEDGTCMNTSMNATLEEAQAYYVGQFFEMSEYKVVMAKFVKQNN